MLGAELSTLTNVSVIDTDTRAAAHKIGCDVRLDDRLDEQLFGAELEDVCAALASFSRRKIRNWEGIHAAKPGGPKGSLVDDD